MDIKSTLEAVEVIKVLGVEAKKIAKDGVNMADLPEALELLKHIDQFVACAKDVHNIGSEIKDLDEVELLALGSALWGAFKAIQAA